MIGDLIGPAFTFVPETGDPADPDVAFTDRFTTTAMTQLADGTVALSYNAVLPGVIELFDPEDGSEARFNTVVSDAVSRFGATFFQDTTSVTVTATPGGGFAAAWIEERSFANALVAARFDAAGAEAGILADRTEGSNRFPDAPALVAVGDAPVLVSETANDTYAVERLGAGGAAPIATYAPSDAPPIVAPLGGGGAMAILHEVDGGGAEPFTDAAFLDFRAADGRPLGPPADLTAGHDGIPGTNVVGLGSLAGGGVVALYTTTTGNGGERALFAELFGPDGVRHTGAPSPRAIDLGLPLGGAGLAGQAGRSLDVVGTPDGGYAIVFKRADDGADSLANFPDTDVYVTIYDADEARIVAPRLVNVGATEGEQGGVGALVTAEGELLVSYYDSPDGAGDVKVQRIELGEGGGSGPVDPDAPTPGDDVLTGDGGPNRIDGLAGNDAIAGLGGADTLLGGAGDDTLEGGPGRDRLEGGPGDDLYRIDDRGDRLIEAVGQGIDRVLATGEVTLGAAEIEQVVLEGLSGLRVNGNAFATEIVGNAGADILIGGGGADTVTGGGGRDFFVFQASDGGGAARIADFTRGADRLALDDRLFGLGDGGVDPRDVTDRQAANALSTGRFDYSASTGELRIDLDGRGGPEAPILIAVLEGGGRIGQDDVLLF